MRDSDRWVVIEEFIGKSSKVMIKKLSRNDCSWADGLSNQSGPYIPQKIRESGFFPPLRNINASKPHIFVCRLPTLWPATGEVKNSRIRHYSNKGPELHFTRIPKEEFAGLTPASLLIGGVLREPEGGANHWFATVDSASELAELLESMFDLKADFHFDLFDPRDAFPVEADDLEQLIRDISAALRDGRLDQFVRDSFRMPSPELLAKSAQTAYMDSEGLAHLDPFVLPNPGDVLMKISRDVEYRLYKRAETRRRAAEVIRTLWDDKQDIVSAVVRNLPALDAIFLSATQQRRSRAGRSFEQHIARLLADGRVDFAEQVVTGGRRPDFILPRLKTFRSKVRRFDEALVLSAKTTLRERWKQITLERLNCPLFLATVDDRVSLETINEMRRFDICLVVPESLKAAESKFYKKHPNVISFKEFFDDYASRFRSPLALLQGLNRGAQ